MRRTSRVAAAPDIGAKPYFRGTPTLTYARPGGDEVAVLAEHLVGRADEIGAIDAALEQVANGRQITLELVGEPGIGKTRLLAELAARAESRGFLVLEGCGAQLERDLPFWVFVDALDEYVQGLDPGRVQALGNDVRTELATVLPSAAAPATGPEAALSHERYRAHRAVRDLLALLAITQPVVLVLDDLHWADPASIELVGALLRRPASGRVLTALALRPRQVGERLSSSLQRAHRNGALERLELGALSRAETIEFLGGTLDGPKASVLHQESGGNPFYLEQLARTLDGGERPSPAAPATSIGGVRVPARVAAALEEELGLLSDGARRVLEGAAVAGDPFDPELAAAAAATSEAAALEALDELLRLDLVRHTDVPRRFRFRHSLVRRAVYEATPGGWRLGAHRRSADALAERGAPASTRAHHVEQGARQGDGAALATLREAGDAAARRAPASAARWFAGALRLLPEDAPAQERIELLLARSGALAATGQFADSHAALIESMAILPDQAGALRVRLTAACAGVEHLLGRPRQARARLESALAELRAVDTPEAVALLIELAVNSVYLREHDAMRPQAARAADAAELVGDPTLSAVALAVRAAAGALGCDADAQSYRDRAAAVIDELSDETLSRRLDALVHLSTAEMYLDHFEASGRHAERALAIGRATGQGELFGLILPTLGTALWLQGRTAEAGEVLEGAVEAARLVDNPYALPWSLVNRSIAALAAGDLELALATAEESSDLARSLDESAVPAWATVALAAALLDNGEAARAAELLMPAAVEEALPRIGGAWRARCHELLTRCLLGAGRREEAERAAEAAHACAEAVALPMAAAMAQRASAVLALDAGDPADAAERALAATALLEEVGDAFDAAATRTLAGRALAQSGERARAASELEAAAAAFHAFGSPRYRAEAERELRRLGHRITRRTQSGKIGRVGLESLTGRELQVARLIVHRKTNVEIAATLFLSRKTVEAHIRNMFVKLGVSSRAAIARAVERADQREAQPQVTQRPES